MDIRDKPEYFVAIFTTRYKSMEEALANAPDTIKAHLARSKELQKKGKLIMAGALTSKPGEPLATMGLFYTREDAEEYAKGDPFVINGMVSDWQIRKWANPLKD
jgi:uncharacterized protein YciI